MLANSPAPRSHPPQPRPATTPATMTALATTTRSAYLHTHACYVFVKQKEKVERNRQLTESRRERHSRPASWLASSRSRLCIQFLVVALNLNRSFVYT